MNAAITVPTILPAASNERPERRMPIDSVPRSAAASAAPAFNDKADLFSTAAPLPQEQPLTGFSGFINRLTQKALTAGVWGAGAVFAEIALMTVTAIGGTLAACAAGLVWPKAGEFLLSGVQKILTGTTAVMPYTALTGAALLGSWLLLHKLDETLSGRKEF